MKTKKWKVTLLVSLILIVAEVVAFFVVGMPAIKVNSLFKKLEAKDAKEARQIYQDLSSGKQDKVKDMLKDFGTYQVNQYTDGKLSYEETADILDAAAGLGKGTDDIMQEYISRADIVELKRLYNVAVADYEVNEDMYSTKYKETSDAFNEIYDSDDDYVDGELKDYIDARYDEFQDGKLEANTMNAYAQVGYYFFAWGTDAFNRASEISSDMYKIMRYQEDYEEAQAYYDEEDYFGCIDYCENELEWDFYDEDDTTGYKDKFTQLKDDAYEAGKTYYLDKAESMINDGDVEGGTEILTQIDTVYGDDVDTSSVWELTRGAWMTPYVEYMQNWDANLQNDINSGVKIGNYDDPATIDYENNKPYAVYLYDIDANGTPELMLRTNDYVYYVLTYDGLKVVFTGAIKLVSVVDAPQMITEPISMPEGYEGYELLSFENNAWTVVEYYIGDGTNYEVNGAPATEEEAEALYDKFYDMESDTYLDYADIEDYEDFIYSYEAE